MIFFNVSRQIKKLWHIWRILKINKCLKRTSTGNLLIRLYKIIWTGSVCYVWFGRDLPPPSLSFFLASDVRERTLDVIYHFTKTKKWKKKVLCYSHYSSTFLSSEVSFHFLNFFFRKVWGKKSSWKWVVKEKSVNFKLLLIVWKVKIVALSIV